MALQSLTCLNFPSKLTHAEALQSGGTVHVSTLLSGSSRGRKDSECAQIGVSSMAGTEGCTMDPPADKWNEELSDD